MKRLQNLQFFVLFSRLMYTRVCLKITLMNCDHDTQDVVMATFKNVECLALDICPTGGYEPEEPKGEPAECIDQEVVTEDYECNPYMAMTYVRDFRKASNPFLSRDGRKKSICL